MSITCIADHRKHIYQQGDTIVKSTCVMMDHCISQVDHPDRNLETSKCSRRTSTSTQRCHEAAVDDDGRQCFQCPCVQANSRECSPVCRPRYLIGDDACLEHWRLLKTMRTCEQEKQNIRACLLFPRAVGSHCLTHRWHFLSGRLFHICDGRT